MQLETQLVVRQLGQQEYRACWQAMQKFTDNRTDETPDEMWLLEHPPIFTQGQSGNAAHILNPGEIPVIPIDRGGQVTYHGPGQLVVYTLVDIKRKKLSIRQFVTQLEKSVIDLLQHYDIEAETKCTAPGVYINDKKICSIGLRIRKGCTFHGLALNIDMDLQPFTRINPCGYAGLQMTQLKEWASIVDLNEVKEKLVQCLKRNLEYS